MVYGDFLGNFVSQRDEKKDGLKEDVLGWATKDHPTL